MATASESETISQMILQHSFHQRVQMQIFVFGRLLQGWIARRTKRNFIMAAAKLLIIQHNGSVSQKH